MANDAYSGIYEVMSKLPYYELIVSQIDEMFVRLVLFTSVVVLYSIFVWHFYRGLSKRDVFNLNLDSITGKFATLKKIGGVLLYIIKYTFAFPVFTFFWFFVFTLVLLTLSKVLSVNEIIFVSLTIVATTRATAYYNEDLSIELSKMLPFAVLAIFLVEPTFFSAELISGRLTTLIEIGPGILRFLLFTIALEWLLRILYQISLFGKKKITTEKSYKSS
ncbi:MAG: hypothetical protein HY361_04225 [Candidatus Aenigmarchaeota archaeon]|nr:hypothetical protein [Candidatus Aenigmarchaeota archaeon]